MPRPDRLCEWEGVQRLLGGSQETAKLLDPDRQGVPLEELKTLSLERGTTRVLMAYGVQNDISALAPPYDKSLQHLAQDAAAIEAWEIGTGGQALPDILQRREDRLEKTFELMTERKRNPAQSPEAPNQHSITEVDPDPDRIGWTRYTLAGGGFS